VCSAKEVAFETKEKDFVSKTREMWGVVLVVNFGTGRVVHTWNCFVGTNFAPKRTTISHLF